MMCEALVLCCFGCCLLACKKSSWWHGHESWSWVLVCSWSTYAPRDVAYHFVRCKISCPHGTDYQSFVPFGKHGNVCDAGTNLALRLWQQIFENVRDPRRRCRWHRKRLPHPQLSMPAASPTLHWKLPLHRHLFPWPLMLPQLHLHPCP